MSRLAPLLGLALVIAAGIWFLLGEAHGPPSKVVAREKAEETPAPRLAGAGDHADPDGATDPEASGRSAWWRLGFRVEGPGGSALPYRKAWLLDGEGRVARTLFPEPGATKGELLVSGACRLVVEAEGLAPGSSDPLVPAEAGRRDVVVRLAPGMPLAGVVYRSDGETSFAVPKVTVETIPHVGAFAGTTHDVATDDDGHFALSGLPPGRVRISVHVMENHGWRRTSVVASAGDENVRVVTEAGDPMCRFHVLVVDSEAGHAPQDTYVAAWFTYDGEESFWLVSHLEPRSRPPSARFLNSFDAAWGSTLRFRVAALGYEQVEPCVIEVPHDAGPHRVTIPLRPRPDQVAHLSVRLIVSGRPAPRVVVGLYDHPEVPIHLEHATENDRLRLRVPVGKARLTVETPWEPDEEKEIQEAYVGDVELALEGGERRALDLALRLGGFLHLVGDPDAWVPTLTLTRGQQTTSRPAGIHEWDEEEGFLFGPVQPGTWTVEYDGTHAHWSGEVEIHAGEVTRVHRDDMEGTPLPPDEGE